MHTVLQSGVRSAFKSKSIVATNQSGSGHTQHSVDPRNDKNLLNTDPDKQIASNI